MVEPKCDSWTVKALLLCALMGFLLAQQMSWMQTNVSTVSFFKSPLLCNRTNDSNNTAAGPGRYSSFEDINKRLVGPPSHGGNGCPKACGCPGTHFDCPRWYDLWDVNASVALGLMEENQKQIETTLSQRHEQVRNGCSQQGGTTSSGGWCLDRPSAAKISYQDIEIPIPKFHVGPSQRVVIELANMIQEEKITSISDFGAGIGQYKAALLTKRDTEGNLTSLKEYNAYDGAGNVEEYTKGFLKFFDLTLPLAMPRTDWVMSLEVGEHVPSGHEGMVVRNLHYHNCRGIIVSWAAVGQQGHAHINNHSNQYVIALFEQLGYRHDEEMSAKFRNADGNYRWLTQTVMVFRRLQNAC